MDYIPRFPGRRGVKCFICNKGKSMTPFCHKHMSCWYKLSSTTKTQLHKMCGYSPEDHQDLIGYMSKLVSEEYDIIETTESVSMLVKTAQAVEKSQKKLDKYKAMLKNLIKYVDG